MAISIPDTLNANSSEKYIMSIRLRPDGLSFSAYNPLETGSFFYRDKIFERNVSFMDNLKDFFFENEVLSYPFKQTYILCEEVPYTLIPKEVSQEHTTLEFLKFNFTSFTGRGISNTLKELPIEIIFGVEEELYEFCCRSLLDPHFIHSITPLLTYWRKVNTLSSRKQMFIYLYNQHVDIVCLEEGRLLFANTFKFKHINDILYYILYVWKQLEMDQEEDQLRVAGESDIRTKIIKILHNYIRSVTISEAPSEVYLWGTEAIQAPLDLLILSICEL